MIDASDQASWCSTPARAIARTMTSRKSGILWIGAPEGVRWIVFLDGNITDAKSAVVGEALHDFGDIGRNGAYAKWIVARAAGAQTASVTFDARASREPNESPNTFGFGRGVALFVEVIRAEIGAEEALAQCGSDARIVDGRNGALLSECALEEADIRLLKNAPGRTVREWVALAPNPEIASVLYALYLIEVFDLVPAAVRGAARDDCDDAVLRTHVRDRLKLVEDGDYFAILGLSRSASGHEVRQAFLALRRTCEAARLATHLADLQVDVQKVTFVLDEAYKILRDAARRDRYRRAIE